MSSLLSTSIISATFPRALNKNLRNSSYKLIKSVNYLKITHDQIQIYYISYCMVVMRTTLLSGSLRAAPNNSKSCLKLSWNASIITSNKVYRTNTPT